jgi:hypothetical protein
MFSGEVMLRQSLDVFHEAIEGRAQPIRLHPDISQRRQ